MKSNKKLIVLCSILFVIICGSLIVKGLLANQSLEKDSTVVVSKEDNLVSNDSSVTTGAVSSSSIEDKKQVSSNKDEKNHDKSESEDINKDKAKNNADHSVPEKKNSSKKNVSSKKDKHSQQSKKDPLKTTKPVQTSVPNPSGTQKPLDTPKPTETKKECSILITCSEVFSHMDSLKESAKKVIPSDGIILQEKCAFNEGETAFDLLKRRCKDKGILLDYSFTAIYSTYYIKGIQNLYEFDCGDESGWLYSVNGVSPSYGCSQYKLKSGDQIVFNFSCER